MSIKFHLPDFAVRYHFNRIFLSMLEHCPQYFYDGVEIASVYGCFPQSLWNGGRTMPGVCDKSFVKKVVREFNKLGIPLRFTFTNPMITEEHLNDDFCNFVLRTAENGKNGVIVISPILEQYIRDKYPGYKITSSTCKRITDINNLNSELDKNYDIVVLDYDFNNKFDMLEKVQNEDILNKYVPMGFNQFKIEGRTATMFNLVEFYLYYMIKPEYKDKARLALLNNLVNNNIINTSF